MYFCYFVIISLGKEPFIWTNLNPLHPRMLCAKFGWNWPSGSGEEDENVKSLWQCLQQRQRQHQGQPRTTDKFWSEKLNWAFGSGELKTSCAEDIQIINEQHLNITVLSLFVFSKDNIYFGWTYMYTCTEYKYLQKISWNFGICNVK